MSDRKKLVIIGNADVSEDYGSFVDICDECIRFNTARNYGINTGFKTTVLCLKNTGSVAKRLWRDRTLADKPYACKAREIWFAKPELSHWYNLILRLLKRKRFREHGRLIISANDLADKQIVYFDKTLERSMWAELRRFGSADAIHISSGCLSIGYVLSQPRFANHDKYLLGFTWEGWAGHPFQEEKAFVRDQTTRGNLQLLQGW